MVRQGKSWKGSGMSQDDFMRKDECLLLDEADRVVGQASKYDCHRFTLEQVCVCLCVCGCRVHDQ